MSLTIDETRVEAFVGQVATDVGAALNTALVALGDRLGLYRAMADAQPVSAADLATRTSTHERYVREWLNTQAASGYLDYDPSSDRYTLPAEHAFVLADESSPVAMAGMIHAAGAVIDGRARVEERFRTGGGIGWHEHHDGLFCGTERAFAANYRAQLVQAWLPALDGVVEKLERGARVADVGCGHGASAILMAQAFPASTFEGFDPTPPRSTRRGGAPPKPAWPTACTSRSPQPRTTRARTTTSSASSTRSTTWATRPAPPGTRARRSPRTARR